MRRAQVGAHPAIQVFKAVKGLELGFGFPKQGPPLLSLTAKLSWERSSFSLSKYRFAPSLRSAASHSLTLSKHQNKSWVCGKFCLSSEALRASLRRFSVRAYLTYPSS